VTAAESSFTFAWSPAVPAAASSCEASCVSSVLRCAPERFSAVVSAVRAERIVRPRGRFERSS
jgi:hypothetical protein